MAGRRDNTYDIAAVATVKAATTQRKRHNTETQKVYKNATGTMPKEDSIVESRDTLFLVSYRGLREFRVQHQEQRYPRMILTARVLVGTHRAVSAGLLTVEREAGHFFFGFFAYKFPNSNTWARWSICQVFGFGHFFFSLRAEAG